MAIAPKQIRAVFYRTPSGQEPVRDWLKASLSPADRKIVGADIATVEYGWPVGMPVCRPLGNGLREVRSTLSNGRIARVLFCIKGEKMVLLTGFVKKTQKTPGAEIDKAIKRMKAIR